jgi:23S rRNA (pseudouridine1915-N3)-methyltransferase
MKIFILTVGRLRGAMQDIYEDYAKRISKKQQFSTVEVTVGNISDEGAANRLENTRIKEILQKKFAGAFVVALDLSGKQMSSPELASFFEKRMMEGRDVVFLIGGSAGLDAELLQMSSEKLSFSRLTFPHQLFRVMLTEQIYRALAIIAGEPYHK